jgi:hypothetical protein
MPKTQGHRLIGQVHIDPDLAIEMFLLDDSGQ